MFSFQRVNVWRAQKTQPNVEQIVGFQQVYAGVNASIQPMSSTEIFWSGQRGIEATHTVYTDAVANVFHFEDILQYVDMGGVEHQFHITGGPLNVLFANRFLSMTVAEYPEAGKKRLNIEAYQ